VEPGGRAIIGIIVLPDQKSKNIALSTFSEANSEKATTLEKYKLKLFDIPPK
jgi:hypothetical protein